MPSSDSPPTPEMVREALKWWDRMKGPDFGKAIPVLAEAAREGLRIQEALQGVWYCQEHQQFNWNRNNCWVFEMGPTGCRMVEAWWMLV